MKRYLRSDLLYVNGSSVLRKSLSLFLFLKAKRLLENLSWEAIRNLTYEDIRGSHHKRLLESLTVEVI